MNEVQVFGFVQDGQLRVLSSETKLSSLVFRLTRIPLQAAQPPESNELDLTSYEGKYIMVSGYDGGEWIYSAAVIDQAGPILSAVIQRIFS